jgi:hypothetical protein
MTRTRTEMPHDDARDKLIVALDIPRSRRRAASSPSSTIP